MGLFSQDDNAEIWKQKQIEKEIQGQIELDLAMAAAQSNDALDQIEEE